MRHILRVLCSCVITLRAKLQGWENCLEKEGHVSEGNVLYTLTALQYFGGVFMVIQGISFHNSRQKSDITTQSEPEAPAWGPNNTYWTYCCVHISSQLASRSFSIKLPLKVLALSESVLCADMFISNQVCFYPLSDWHHSHNASGVFFWDSTWSSA